MLTISAGENRGLDALWEKIVEHKERMTASGEFAARRGAQAVAWMHDLLQERLLAALQADAVDRAAHGRARRPRCEPVRARRRLRSASWWR